MKGLASRPPRATAELPGMAVSAGERFVASILAFGFLSFVIASFLPVSSKIQNNIFYALCAMPTVFWFVFHPDQICGVLKRFTWFWLCLILLAGGAVLHGDIGSLKDVLYVAVLFLSLELLWRSGAGLHQRIFDCLAVISIVALVAASALWLQHWTEGEQAPRISLWDELHPIRTALLVGCGLVSLWVFRISPWTQTKPVWSRLGALFLIVLLLVWCSVVFQSRSLLLGIFAFLLYELLLGRRLWSGLLVLFLVSLAVWLLGWHEMLLQRGLSYRLEIWLDGWNRLYNVCGLVRGCGDDGFRFIGTYAHPHSAYWSILYANGLLIFLFIAAALIALFAKGVSHQSRWLAVALIGWGGVFTTTGGVVHSPAEYWIYFWFPTFFAMFECSALSQTPAGMPAVAGEATDR